MDFPAKTRRRADKKTLIETRARFYCQEDFTRVAAPTSDDETSLLHRAVAAYL